MQLLKLTTTSDGPTYINLESIVEIYPHEQSTTLILSTRKYSTEVAEPIKVILYLITFAQSRTSGTLFDPTIICPELYV